MKIIKEKKKKEREVSCKHCSISLRELKKKKKIPLFFVFVPLNRSQLYDI